MCLHHSIVLKSKKVKQMFGTPYFFILYRCVITLCIFSSLRSLKSTFSNCTWNSLDIIRPGCSLRRLQNSRCFSAVQLSVLKALPNTNNTLLTCKWIPVKCNINVSQCAWCSLVKHRVRQDVWICACRTCSDFMWHSVFERERTKGPLWMFCKSSTQVENDAYLCFLDQKP